MNFVGFAGGAFLGCFIRRLPNSIRPAVLSQVHQFSILLFLFVGSFQGAPYILALQFPFHFTLLLLFQVSVLFSCELRRQKTNHRMCTSFGH